MFRHPRIISMQVDPRVRMSCQIRSSNFIAITGAASHEGTIAWGSASS